MFRLLSWFIGQFYIVSNKKYISKNSANYYRFDPFKISLFTYTAMFWCPELDCFNFKFPCEIGTIKNEMREELKTKIILTTDKWKEKTIRLRFRWHELWITNFNPKTKNTKNDNNIIANKWWWVGIEFYFIMSNWMRQWVPHESLKILRWNTNTKFTFWNYFNMENWMGTVPTIQRKLNQICPVEVRTLSFDNNTLALLDLIQ